MGTIAVCDGTITFASGESAPFSCSGSWIFKPEPSTDFQGLIDLLSFNPEICASLIGVCLVIFIIGYSGGKVSRILSRR